MILSGKERLLHGMKGIHVIYPPHSVDTYAFSLAALAGMSVHTSTCDKTTILYYILLYIFEVSTSTSMLFRQEQWQQQPEQDRVSSELTA